MRNIPASSNFGSSTPLPESAPSPFFGVVAPFYEPPDAGAGSGGGSSSSSGGNGDADGAGAGGDAAAVGASGGGTPYKLTDDSLVDFGDGKPVKWSEARSSRFMDRSSYDRGVEFLTNMAKQLDQRSGSNAGGRPGQAQRPGPQVQPQAQRQSQLNLDELENLAVADGRTLAKVVRALQAEGLGPLAGIIGQMAQRQKTLEDQLGQVRQTAGSLAETHSSNEFESLITTTLQSVPEIKGLGAIPADDPAIRELAKDIFLSHDQSDKTLLRDFPKLLQERVEGMVKLVTTMQKAARDASEKKRRSFFKPGGGAAKPNGAGGYEHLSGAELAKRFFGAQELPT